MDKGSTPFETLIPQMEVFDRVEGKSQKTLNCYDTSLHGLLKVSQDIFPDRGRVSRIASGTRNQQQ